MSSFISFQKSIRHCFTSVYKKSKGKDKGKNKKKIKKSKKKESIDKKRKKSTHSVSLRR
jgi:hypothetical protein